MDRWRAPEHAAGLLDALLWADDLGRAVALFGSKPSLRSLDESSISPAFGMVDLIGGRLIASLTFRDAMMPLVPAGEQLDRIDVESGAAAILSDGRMRVFTPIRGRRNGDDNNWIRSWLVWTEGETPRLLPQPYPQPNVGYGLAPDGATVLAVLPLGPDTLCGRTGGCQSVGPPAEGPLVVAHDLLTGAVIWTLRATAGFAKNYATPVVSPDGRLALVALPSPDGGVGVVDMTNGQILQRLRAIAEVAFGFFREGRCAFVYAPDNLQIYQVGAGIPATQSPCIPPL
jgi:hypothetical protein